MNIRSDFLEKVKVSTNIPDVGSNVLNKNIQFNTLKKEDKQELINYFQKKVNYKKQKLLNIKMKILEIRKEV